MVENLVAGPGEGQTYIGSVSPALRSENVILLELKRVQPSSNSTHNFSFFSKPPEISNEDFAEKMVNFFFT